MPLILRNKFKKNVFGNVTIKHCIDIITALERSKRATWAVAAQDKEREKFERGILEEVDRQ